METAVMDALAGANGLLLTRDLVASGVRQAQLQDWTRLGLITRVRRGAFVASDVWNASTSDARHRLLVHATAQLHPTTLLFSHYAAAALHRLPLIGPWPTRIHVLEPQALGGSSMPALLIHRTTPSRDNRVIDGVQTTAIERTLVDIACSAPFLQAVGMIDCAMHDGRVTTDALLTELAYVSPGRGAKKAARAIYFGDPRCESVGESLSRVRMWDLGFEMPDLQKAFRTPDGTRALVDFYWPRGCIVGEFDGREKYLNPALAQDRSTQMILLAEKDREDRIRPQVGRFFRWGWDLAWNQNRFEALLSSNGIPRRGLATF